MRRFLEEYGMFAAYFIIMLSLAAALFAYTYEYAPLQEKVPEVKNLSAGSNQDLAGKELPTLKVRSAKLALGDTFNPMEHVTQATDRAGNDLRSQVVAYDADSVDTSKKGMYIVTYVVKDNEELTTRLEASFLVD